MFSSYQNQVCIVTGASSGIGAALAAALDKRGAKVVMFARREELLRQVADGLHNEPLIVVGDVTNSDDRAVLVEQTQVAFGRVDALINNAGRGQGVNEFVNLQPDVLENILQVNLVSAVHLTHAVLPSMLAQGSGLIINVSSPMGHVGYARRILYGVSKAGLSMFSQSLGRELRPHGIHVMDLRPGITISEMITTERAATFPFFIPVKSADEVAEAALKGALKRKRIVLTAGFVERVAMQVNRNFPGIVDRVIGRLKY